MNANNSTTRLFIPTILIDRKQISTASTELMCLHFSKSKSLFLVSQQEVVIFKPAPPQKESKRRESDREEKKSPCVLVCVWFVCDGCAYVCV